MQQGLVLFLSLFILFHAVYAYTTLEDKAVKEIKTIGSSRTASTITSQDIKQLEQLSEEFKLGEEVLTAFDNIIDASLKDGFDRKNIVKGEHQLESAYRRLTTHINRWKSNGWIDGATKSFLSHRSAIRYDQELILWKGRIPSGVRGNQISSINEHLLYHYNKLMQSNKWPYFIDAKTKGLPELSKKLFPNGAPRTVLNHFARSEQFLSWRIPQLISPPDESITGLQRIGYYAGDNGANILLSADQRIAVENTFILYDDVIKKAYPNADPAHIAKLESALIDSIVFQEVEATRAVWSNHGVAHLVGNIHISDNYISQLIDAAKINPQALEDIAKTLDVPSSQVVQILSEYRAQTMTAMLLHDMGYTAETVTSARNHAIFPHSGQHPFLSAAIFDEEYANLVKNVMGDAASQNIHSAIYNHPDKVTNLKTHFVDTILGLSDDVQYDKLIPLTRDERAMQLFFDAHIKVAQLENMNLPPSVLKQAKKRLVTDLQSILKAHIESLTPPPPWKESMLASIDGVSDMMFKFHGTLLAMESAELVPVFKDGQIGVDVIAYTNKDMYEFIQEELGKKISDNQPLKLFEVRLSDEELLKIIDGENVEDLTRYNFELSAKTAQDILDDRKTAMFLYYGTDGKPYYVTGANVGSLNNGMVNAHVGTLDTVQVYVKQSGRQGLGNVQLTDDIRQTLRKSIGSRVEAERRLAGTVYPSIKKRLGQDAEEFAQNAIRKHLDEFFDNPSKIIPEDIVDLKTWAEMSNIWGTKDKDIHNAFTNTDFEKLISETENIDEIYSARQKALQLLYEGELIDEKMYFHLDGRLSLDYAQTKMSMLIKEDNIPLSEIDDLHTLISQSKEKTLSNIPETLDEATKASIVSQADTLLTSIDSFKTQQVNSVLQKSLKQLTSDDFIAITKWADATQQQSFYDKLVKEKFSNIQSTSDLDKARITSLDEIKYLHNNNIIDDSTYKYLSSRVELQYIDEQIPFLQKNTDISPSIIDDLQRKIIIHYNDAISHAPSGLDNTARTIVDDQVASQLSVIDTVLSPRASANEEVIKGLSYTNKLHVINTEVSQLEDTAGRLKSEIDSILATHGNDLTSEKQTELTKKLDELETIRDKLRSLDSQIDEVATSISQLDTSIAGVDEIARMADDTLTNTRVAREAAEITAGVGLVASAEEIKRSKTLSAKLAKLFRIKSSPTAARIGSKITRSGSELLFRGTYNGATSNIILRIDKAPLLSFADKSKPYFVSVYDEGFRKLGMTLSVNDFIKTYGRHFMEVDTIKKLIKEGATEDQLLKLFTEGLGNDKFANTLIKKSMIKGQSVILKTTGKVLGELFTGPASFILDIDILFELVTGENFYTQVQDVSQVCTSPFTTVIPKFDSRILDTCLDSCESIGCERDIRFTHSQWGCSGCSDLLGMKLSLYGMNTEIPHCNLVRVLNNWKKIDQEHRFFGTVDDNKKNCLFLIGKSILFKDLNTMSDCDQFNAIEYSDQMREDCKTIVTHCLD